MLLIDNIFVTLLQTKHLQRRAEPKSQRVGQPKQTNIMEWYLTVLRRYADFSGRSRRKEYWMYTLFNLIFMIIAAVLDNVLGLTFHELLPYGYIYLAYALIVLIPGLAVAVRRMHDIGKSGWMLFVAIIPLVGAIWLLVLLVTEGENRDNKWGANPKQLPLFE
jgi:uncharacterized membrane protein YhaH (DUF805 family)